MVHSLLIQYLLMIGSHDEYIYVHCIYVIMYVGNEHNTLWRSPHRFTSASVFLPYSAGFSLCTYSCTVGKKEVSFSITIGNEKLTHECFPKHLRMGTARMK